jgi:hypothetical protein
MATFISPDQALEMAQSLMLDGREASSEEDWAKVLNCVAANVAEEVAEPICLLMKTLYDIPLDEGYIREMVDYQNDHRER